MGMELTPWEKALSIARAEIRIGQEFPRSWDGKSWEEKAEERRREFGGLEVENLLSLARELVADRNERREKLKGLIIGQLEEVFFRFAGIMGGHFHDDWIGETPFGDDNICNEQWQIFEKGIRRGRKVAPALYALQIIVGRAIEELVNEIDVSQLQVALRNEEGN